MAFWLCGKNAGKIMNLIFRYIQKPEYYLYGRAEYSYDVGEENPLFLEAKKLLDPYPIFELS